MFGVAALISRLFGEVALTTPASAEMSDLLKIAPPTIALKGYRIKIDGFAVEIKRDSIWATVAGIPSLYYFKGMLNEGVGANSLNGRILVAPIIKCFLTIWFGVVIFALLAALLFLGWEILSLFIEEGRIRERSSVTPLVGVATLLSSFGLLMIGGIRVAFSRQKRKLIAFCSQWALKANDEK